MPTFTFSTRIRHLLLLNYGKTRNSYSGKILNEDIEGRTFLIV